jgi:hypothetical protein
MSRAPSMEGLDGTLRNFAHKGQLISIGVGEFGQPELGSWRSMHDVRLGHKRNALSLERREGLGDAWHLKISG